MDAARHRVWPYAGLAWVALVSVPVAYAVWRWEIGIGRDPDMSGVGELVAQMVFVLSLPMAALAFGVFAPLAVGLDLLLKGRAPRTVNVLLGALLAVPALAVTVLAVGWPEHSTAELIARLPRITREFALVGAHVAAGIMVGLGLRHPRQPPARFTVSRRWFIS